MAPRPSRPSRRRGRRLAATAGLLAAVLVGAALPSFVGGAASAAPSTGAATAALSSTLAGTGSNVPGYCSTAGLLVDNRSGTVKTLRVSLSPASPRAGAKVTVKVFVKQTQRTPAHQAYPVGTLQGQVVVAFGSSHRVLVGPVNKTKVSGVIFPGGWTAKATMRAPKSGKRKLVVDRIVYNLRDSLGLSGGWGSAYAGNDLVCSGGLNPTTTVTPYARPRLTVKVRT